MIHPIFIAVNSRYNHTNLAVRSLASYIHAQTGIQSIIVEKSTSEPFSVLLRSLFDALDSVHTDKTTLVLFSIYIWNAPIMYSLAEEVKKVFPNIILGCGGPEVSYNASQVFSEVPSFDFIVRGEGEETLSSCVKLFSSLIDEQPACDTQTDMLPNSVFVQKLKEVPGIYINFKSNNEEEEKVFFTGERQLLCSLDELAFPYPSLQVLVQESSEAQVSVGKKKMNLSHLPFTDRVDVKNHIFYYESSRGCPFRCSYCLSSLDKSVRFLSLERVCKDIQLFIDAGVSLVKFVDRTFNLNEERYLAIWKYIIEHHNKVTMFHFEIAAEQCTDKVLDFLQSVPEDIMQFEVGVQTMNTRTLSEIKRPFNKAHLESVIKRIPHTIHLHLDLIAGLPHEDITSFRTSFDQTIALKPDMLQLGFLKILHGTQMEQFALEHPEYRWLSIPPYEVLQSPSMSFRDVLFLKDIENVCDAYYNSGNFISVFSYLIDKSYSLFAVFESLVLFFKAQNLFENKHTLKTYAGFLSDYVESAFFKPLHDADIFVLKELLRFDFLRGVKPGSFPAWFTRHYSKDAHHKALLEHGERKSTREAYSYSEYEEFNVHPYTYEKRKTAVLFLYPKPQEGVKGKTEIIIL